MACFPIFPSTPNTGFLSLLRLLDTDEPLVTEIAKQGKKEGTIESKQHEKPAYRYWVSERSVGEFQRTFAFPAKVDRERIKANLKNGILTVVVPKLLKEAESKKIVIGS